MRVAILGYAVEGKESAKYWGQQGAEITICDQNADLEIDNPRYRTQLGDRYLNNLAQYDLIVRTAGLHPQKILEANPGQPEIKNKITSSTNEFFSRSPSQNIIGVTGTKGKGTTSTLVAKILEAAGKKVHLGGNIGIAPLQMLPQIQPDDWVVLELGAFQLIDIKKSPTVAICLMVVPEHLDWFADFKEYVEAKSQLFRWQNADDLAVYNALSKASVKTVAQSKARKLPYEVPPPDQPAQHKEAAHVEVDTVFFGSSPICDGHEVKLLGRHNLENICASINATWNIINGNIEAIRQVVQTFSGLEHRIEFVRELDGVKYYDDSFATTPETTIAALRAFPDSPKVIILGGHDKGIPFDSLADEVVKSNVRHAIVIGNTGPAIEKLLRERNFTDITPGITDMSTMVQIAHQKAQKGDVVLLSTGCASFGLFKDYKDRGNQFKAAVNTLAG